MVIGWAPNGYTLFKNAVDGGHAHEFGSTSVGLSLLVCFGFGGSAMFFF